jgi:hypothetical protein
MKSSRRRFLQTTLSGPLAASLGGSGLRTFGALQVVPGQGQFENPHIIRYDSSCFTINGRDTCIRSAAFHYPRCPKALWRDRLVKFQQAGFNTLETYVFWNYHEPEEGKANLVDFEDFIKLIQEMGFWMIVRPGPYVCAEWERGGFPSWVAAKRFPLRSNHPESLATSQHWFNLVLPIIQRHQITVGGPVIMVQVENEYDYSPPMRDADKREYIRALANLAWNAGIDVPIITCWTKQARENSDPDMARILDTCNFYPRWDVVKSVVPELEKLRKEEPASPLGITELQGGWFSEFGGRLSVDQEGVSGAQLNLLTKTALEQGVTYFSYYMGFGGTNFDWAAKNLTTTYDYAAPLREPGGLWEKYYAAHGICQSLRLFGEVLTRAQRVAKGVECSNANVSVTERTFVKSGVVFVRENANAEQHFKMAFIDPNSPTHRRIDVPREGELALGARGMKMFPVQLPIAGGRLCYSTAEVLAHGRNLDRNFLILYDEPGQLAEIALATENEPKVEGDTAYKYWDSEYESAIIGVRVEKREKMLLFNEYLQIVVAPRDRALRSWSAEFPSQVVLGAEETKPMAVPFLSDCYLLAASGSHGHRLWVDLDFLPGEHELTVLLPPRPSKCRVDGALSDFQYDRQWRTARVHVTTPALPFQPVILSEVRTWVERFGGQIGAELSPPRRAPLRPLEAFGPAPYGYVKFMASQFSYSGQPKMFITTFANDGKKVFLNDRLVVEASNSEKQAQFDLAPYARQGINNLQISYESFGASNGGEDLGDLKGIESVKVGTAPETATAVNPWQIQRFPAGMKDRTVDPEFSIGGWQPASLQPVASAKELIPAFTWCRAEFVLPKPSEGWTIPWRLVFEADRDALLYLNGKFVGRYVTVGPQKEFYLPEPYLVFESNRKNILTIVLAYTDQASHIRTLRLAPYEEYSVQRTRVEFEW